MKPSSVRLPQNFSPTGYEPLEILHQGRHSLVYRALRSEDQTSVIIKTTLPQVVLQSSHYLAFRNQFTLSQYLDHPGIIQILSLEPCHQSYALVMEDVQGIPLSEFLKSSVPLQEGLTIALQLTEVLYYLAQQRVLHKDIKPANILIHPQTLQIKLIDFGIASLLPKETQDIKNPNALEGTLAYMAPEQTGRMNRGIDFRSDFYGFGVTLFELFAGQLPFQADEPMEWLHCHIAQMPPSLTEFGVPEPVANIVAKLLAKNAEDRYQSALGLKHDLEQCLTQLRERSEIEPFELGQEDRCDRILIPEKLYGRAAEVKALLDTFDRVAQGSSELMLVAGFSGIGKTAVINEVHKPITQRNGYFIKGKFDQFNRNIPFSAFVQAFWSLVEQLLGESDETLADWQAKILAAVGESGQVLIEVIPELERIIGKQQVVNALSGSAAQNRFNLIFSKFIRVFTTYDHPLVIFLDDLQWVDSASLNLLQLLMDDDSGFLLVVGAYRDNEVLPEHPLIMTLANVKKRATVNTLTLNALRENDIRNLVADSLHCSVELTLPFAQLVYQKTKGNPFFATQFIQGLAEEGWITYSVKTGYWQCDLTQVHQLALTDDVVMFMVKQIQKLPNATQATLKIAACIGNRFDLATMSAILEERQEDVSTNLLHALQVGLVIPDNQTYKFFQGSKDEIRKLDDITVKYRFLHDRVQQAAYALILENEKHITHAKIGKFLLKKSSADQHGDSFFEIVNHLNKCIEFDSSQPKRLELLQLNCIAGKRAKASAAYVASVSYLDIAKQLLPVDSWQQMYKQSLDIYFNLAESQYLSGNFQESLGLVETIVSVSKQPLEQAEALNLAVLQCTLQGKFLEAIHYGQRALKYLNFELPTTNLAEQLKSYQAEINTKLAAYKIEELVNIPENNNTEQHVIIKVLNNLFVPTYVLQNEDLYFFITLSIILITLDFGMVVGASYGFAFYGMFLGGRLGDYKLGYKFGLLAQQIAKRFNQNGNLCKVLYTFGNNLLPWVQPLRNSEPIFREGLAVGLESGELVFSGNILMYQPLNPFYAGDNISDIHKDLPKYLKFADRTLKYQLAIDVISGLNIWLSHILESPNKDIPTEAEFIAQCESNNSTYAICHYWILKTKILCLSGQYEEALASAQNAEAIISVITGKYQVGALNFYQSIAIIEHQRINSHINNSLIPNGDYLQKIEVNQTQLRKWAETCSENFAHKYNLVEASLNSLLGNQLQAIEKFDLAISGAKENGYLQEEALANELAAKFYLDWGKDKVASTYMQEAYHCYARWGAKAKTNDLERRYPDLLQPILQVASPSINPLDTLASLVAPNLSIHSSASVQSTQTNFNTVFDFSAILKGAQVLSESLHTDELLETLAPMMLQNSGADRLVFLLPNADTWQIRATATPDTTQLCTVPLTDHPDLPLQLIQYVKNTQETLVIDDLTTDLPILDRYLETHQPQSVLCLPILYQSHLRGMLFLQNQLASGVFTRDRITVLNFLCSQAAISLENARLFSERLDIESELHQLNTQLDQRVQERTQELTQTLDTLKSTQASLVEAEKMAALGTLVAGVAHEINTPIGTSITVASTLADESEVFVQAAESGQLKRSTLNHFLGVVRQCTQLITSNLDRAGDLIKSFKQIAVDQSHRELRTFNLKDYVEEVVTSLQPQVKRSGHHLSVTGAEAITLTNDPGVIAQIITNLVTNSIKHAYPDGGVGQLQIQIEQREQQAMLTYRDNGCGIPSEHLSKVYDPFFTTARHQGGTGLGLNIVYNIVTQSLKGTIQMDSQLGQGTTFAISIPLEQDWNAR